MNTKTVRTVAAAVVASSFCFAGEKLKCGLEFQAPAGWTVRAETSAALLLPPDMVAEPSGDPAEVYIVALLPGVRDLQDPQLAPLLQGKFFPGQARVNTVGAPRAFRAANGSGYVHTFEAAVNGSAVRMDIYAVALQPGGVAAVVAVGRRELVLRREPVLAVAAASVAQPTAGVGTNGALAQQWIERLGGRKLMQFSSYSSGYGSGGYSSQKTLFLAGDGAYVFSRSSSVSIYTGGANGGSASQGGAQGRWRIYEQGGQAMLELAPSNGAVEQIRLTNQAGKTLLNGNRWLIGD